LWSTGGSWGGLPDYIKLWTPRLDALKAAGNRPDWVPDRGNNNADRSWDYTSAHHTPRGGFDRPQPENFDQPRRGLVDRSNLVAAVACFEVRLSCKKAAGFVPVLRSQQSCKLRVGA